jgi:hypothetical protein
MFNFTINAKKSTAKTLYFYICKDVINLGSGIIQQQGTEGLVVNDVIAFLCKPGGSFSPDLFSIWLRDFAEIGYGWYSIGLLDTDLDTIGQNLLNINYNSSCSQIIINVTESGYMDKLDVASAMIDQDISSVTPAPGAFVDALTEVGIADDTPNGITIAKAVKTANVAAYSVGTGSVYKGLTDAIDAIPTPPTASTIAAEVRTNLAVELAAVLESWAAQGLDIANPIEIDKSAKTITIGTMVLTITETDSAITLTRIA